MLIVSESIAQHLVTMEDAIAAVEAVFATLGRDQAYSYPVVRESVGATTAVFGVKSGFDAEGMVLGLKAGGYWPANAGRGLSNHQSVTVLFDQATGRARAVVSANYLTGIRTAASSALAAKYLARSDARVLGIIGTGTQAPYQVRAISALLPLARVVAWNRSPERLDAFGRDVGALGLPFEAATKQEVARQADVLVTVTSAASALVEKSWVRAGTHVSAMGADTAGKQELSPELVAAASVYVDSIEQAISIGECQHAHRRNMLPRDAIKGTLGQLVNHAVPGRTSPDEITIFDGTGIALQDLAVAALALQLAEERGLAVDVDF